MFNVSVILGFEVDSELYKSHMKVSSALRLLLNIKSYKNKEKKHVQNKVSKMTEMYGVNNICISFDYLVNTQIHHQYSIVYVHVNAILISS